MDAHATPSSLGSFDFILNGIDDHGAVIIASGSLGKTADELQEIIQFQRFFEHPRDPKRGRALDDVSRKEPAHEQHRNVVFLLTQL